MSKIQLFTREPQSWESHSLEKKNPRPLMTYNKTQITESIKFITLNRNNDHRIRTDEFDNLTAVIDLQYGIWYPFFSQHQTLGKLHIIPTLATAHITCKCTKCPFRYQFKSSNKLRELQGKHTTYSVQKGIYRKNLLCPERTIHERISSPRLLASSQTAYVSSKPLLD